MRQSPSDAYLTQRVLSATPEQQMALLMEAGQKFIGIAIRAIEQKNHQAAAAAFCRIGDIITESAFRLDHENSTELIKNLTKIYDWWLSLLFEASASKDIEKLRLLSKYMGEIGSSWEKIPDNKSVIV